MIKAKAGDDLYLFGLSEGNLRLLREGKPLVVDLVAMKGPDIRIAIMWGETEEAIVNELRRKGMIDENARAVDGRRS